MALNLYEVSVRNHTTTMQLSDDDAEAYRERDGLTVTKVGSVKPAGRQDVTAPPYAVDEDGKRMPEGKSGAVRSRSRQPQNKSAE